MAAIMSRSTRVVKKIEKPKPLKIIPSRHSTSDIPGQGSVSTVEDILILLDIVSSAISRKNLNDEFAYYTATLISKLKIYGQRLEENYKDQLDKAFTQFRNGSKDDNIDIGVRSNLLHLIELRAMQWSLCASINAYYSTRCLCPEVNENQDFTTPISNNNILLGPGEIIKSTGKYSTPTKVPGKNYFKDEVVIRNSDSGKVMGIKGRRVHMIEELSETVISFQRVSPGAKERNVQITGPEEEKIVLAKQLIEDTIKRNASPVREIEKDIGSNSSLNSSASDDSAHIGNHNTGKMFTILQVKEDGYEYKHSVVVGGKTIRLSSNDHEWLKWAKLVLETAAKKKETQVTSNTKQTQTITSISKDSGAVQRLLEQIPPVPPKNNEVENKNETINKVDLNESTKKNVTHRKHTVRLIQYSRDYLMDLSCVSTATEPPPDWDRICQHFPNIVKQGKTLFDPVLYSKKWLENDEKSISSIIDGNIDYLDSE